ncbi:LysM peptidoglycan-binding domain-containing protein [Kocuria soli]|uniref:LysM peptidoglycan-binding domain-containing protein n=2 Tax=Kocuria soli TaxID=2485125 RepID=A0A3N3ZPQ0_9MICC|nr:LysM peptidoglycan-binding domain-containing protein [Kocuria soli]
MPQRSFIPPAPTTAESEPAPAIPTPSAPTAPKPTTVPQQSIPGSLFAPEADPAEIPTEHPHGTHEYVIIPGDTLSEIAERYDIEGGWQALYAANDDTLRSGAPDLIFPGEIITLNLS